jgi:hypothetical protein
MNARERGREREGGRGRERGREGDLTTTRLIILTLF